MQNLEIIHLRMGSIFPQSLVNEILKLPIELQNNIDLMVYQLKGLSSDLSVHIFHQANGQKLPSPLGEVVASSLREHGIVNHSIWAEEKRLKR